MSLMTLFIGNSVPLTSTQELMEGRSLKNGMIAWQIAGQTVKKGMAE